MAEFLLKCPKCSQKLKLLSLPESGRQIECPKCGKPILVNRPKSVTEETVFPAGVPTSEPAPHNLGMPDGVGSFPVQDFNWRAADKPKKRLSRKTKRLVALYAGIFFSALAVGAICLIILNLPPETFRSMNLFADNETTILRDFDKYSGLVEGLVHQADRIGNSFDAMKLYKSAEPDMEAYRKNLARLPDRWSKAALSNPIKLAESRAKFSDALQLRPGRIRKLLDSLKERRALTERFETAISDCLRQIDFFVSAVEKAKA